MTNTQRTSDKDRDERQRAERTPEAARVRDEGRKDPGEGEDRQRLLDEKPFDFIERSKPEDRMPERSGQLTRDNVNPAIPSAEPGKGGIVQPESTQGGVAPPSAPEQRHTEEQEAALVHARAQHVPSINEPPGSDIVAGDAGPVEPPELPPLMLSDLEPDAMVVGSGTFALTVTGSGFTPESVVVFDDADVPTTFVSPTSLTADCPVAAAATTVDVEVHRGEDMSDVLLFEFTAVMREGREKKPPERKPKKETPAHKRPNKRR